MRFALYRFPCDMLRALTCESDEPPAAIDRDPSFAELCDKCERNPTCSGTFLCETDLTSRGLQHHLRSRGERRL